MKNDKKVKLMIEGTPMDYVVFGKGTTPLVMLPGLSDGLTTVGGKTLLLSQYYKIFAKHFRVYVFSRRHDLPANYTTKDMARDQKTAMDKLGIEKAHVFGISQGGMIAQHLAINYPQAVSKLVLAVTVSRQNDTLQKVVKAWIKMAENNDYASLVVDTTEKTYTEKKAKQYQPLYPILKRVGKPKSFDRFLIQANACITHNAYTDLPKIKCPVLVIGGNADHVVGANCSEEIAAQIKDSQLIIYDGLGHGAYEEAKDFNQKVLEFLL